MDCIPSHPWKALALFGNNINGAAAILTERCTRNRKRGVEERANDKEGMKQGAKRKSHQS